VAIGLMDLLGEDARVMVDERNCNIMKITQKELRAMLQLINDILDISKIRNGKLTIDLVPCQIASVIKDSMTSNGILADGKGIRLVNEVPDHLPFCLADPRRVMEILSNLISNAIKFSERNTCVTLSARHAEEGGEVIVEVRDQGLGIPEDEQSRLFGMFEQISVRSTEGETGTGLGLAIVEKLVDLHEGRVWVKSKVGEGSVFSFSLPLARTHD
ncbi:MAG: HAMP domain-containing histidine kinase, partial [Planctomycetes bacterium]|nr:HAMP domain-containing histidine kinase [Planctomycetota bacterium]